MPTFGGCRKSGTRREAAQQNRGTLQKTDPGWRFGIAFMEDEFRQGAGSWGGRNNSRPMPAPETQESAAAVIDIRDEVMSMTVGRNPMMESAVRQAW
jgi:hypothetical protein